MLETVRVEWFGALDFTLRTAVSVRLLDFDEERDSTVQ